MILTEQLQALFDDIDAANQQDPNQEEHQGKTVAKEWLYGQRMSACLNRFAADSGACLQIAARAQHIQRWQSPRADYPAGRDGYNQWRRELAVFHGQCVGQLMAKQGYDESDILRVQTLLQKKGLKRDSEVQTLEDVACLVFLEYYLSDFAAKHSDEKLISIIQKTWRKMSENGHKAALALPLDPAMLPLIKRALDA